MSMRSIDAIQEMLGRFDEADQNGELDEGGQGARSALMWVMCQETGEGMDELLPEQEECPDCGDTDCSGAAGGTCDDAEDEEDLEGGQYRH